jgi:hypothetical protein
MTDRLSLANALADAKMDRPAAERVATEIFSAIHDNVATQGDLNAARTELKADIAAVKADLSGLELRLEARIDRVVVRLGSLVVVVAGLLFVALRYLPPPH